MRGDFPGVSCIIVGVDWGGKKLKGVTGLVELLSVSVSFCIETTFMLCPAHGGDGGVPLVSLGQYMASWHLFPSSGNYGIPCNTFLDILSTVYCWSLSFLCIDI